MTARSPRVRAAQAQVTAARYATEHEAAAAVLSAMHIRQQKFSAAEEETKAACAATAAECTSGAGLPNALKPDGLQKCRAARLLRKHRSPAPAMPSCRSVKLTPRIPAVALCCLGSLVAVARIFSAKGKSHIVA